MLKKQPSSTATIAKKSPQKLPLILNKSSCNMHPSSSTSSDNQISAYSTKIAWRYSWLPIVFEEDTTISIIYPKLMVPSLVCSMSHRTFRIMLVYFFRRRVTKIRIFLFCGVFKWSLRLLRSRPIRFRRYTRSRNLWNILLNWIITPNRYFYLT